MNEERSGGRWFWVLAIAGLAALFALWYLLPVTAWMQAFQAWIEDHLVLGAAVYCAFYVVATVALFPGAPLTLLGGLAFGLLAFPLVVVSATVGAVLAFLTGRFLARDRVARRFAGNRRFRAIDQAVSEEGWKVVGLLRLSPLVPFNLQNYLYGLTRISLPHYAVATFFGIMPGTLLYVYLGAAGKAALSGGASGGGAFKWLLFAIGLAATVLVTVLVTRRAKAKLDAIGLEEPAEDAAT